MGPVYGNPFVLAPSMPWEFGGGDKIMPQSSLVNMLMQWIGMDNYSPPVELPGAGMVGMTAAIPGFGTPGQAQLYPGGPDTYPGAGTFPGVYET